MIRFGVAGYPPAFGESAYRKNRIDIFRWLAELGLTACELQMTYGPRMSPETCREYRKVAEDHGVRISVHASYFIVFTSDDAVKIERSSDTLKRTYELTDLLGADVVVLHPGPLYGQPSQSVMDRFCENASRCLTAMGQTNIGLFVETAGKVGQLGSLQEILKLSSSLEGVHPCVDFGHVHARTLGTLDSQEPIARIVEELNNFQAKTPKKRLHFHYTPIHFGKRGEIQHKAINDRYPTQTQESLFDCVNVGTKSIDGYYHPRPNRIAEELVKIKSDFTVISETHNSQQEGAIFIRDHFLSRK